MTLLFPSPEFDAAVAGVCHGSATEAEMKALNVLLRCNGTARDDYLFKIELHTRIASAPDLFSRPEDAGLGSLLPVLNLDLPRNSCIPTPPAPMIKRKLVQALALACLTLLAAAIWAVWFRGPSTGPTSAAVAMLTRTVDARWDESTIPLRTGSPLEPGWIQLESGLAQIVFYSGARVVIEGPARLQIVSPAQAFCPLGRLLAEVPQPARGFRLSTDHLNVVDLGTAFGIDAKSGKTEVHVFKGEVDMLPESAPKQSLRQGQAAAVQPGAAPKLMAASTAEFTALFEFQERSLAAEAFRYEQWQLANARLNQDPSLLVHLEFQDLDTSDWTLRNSAEKNRSVQEATVVGCQRAEGRWREKQALAFQSVNDRVRLSVPGEFQGLTLSAWASVKGLDRQFNSLFMSDGFEPGTIHWLIRNDGVLGLSVFGHAPRQFEIAASPAVIALDRLGMWTHLAVVVDGKSRQVVHYVNGSPVSRHPLKVPPPYRVGGAELGNWKARTGPSPAPALIRNLSGAVDEFELFSRALSDGEIRELYTKGKPGL